MAEIKYGKGRPTTERVNGANLNELQKLDKNCVYCLFGNSYVRRLNDPEFPTSHSYLMWAQSSLSDITFISGIGGDKICNAEWRIEDGRILEHMQKNPYTQNIQKVVILLGINDIALAKPKQVDKIDTQAMLDGIVRITNHFQTTYPDIHISYIRCPKFRLLGDNANAKVEEFNIRLADKYKESVHTLTGLLDSDEYLKPCYQISETDLHLNEDGYRIFISILEKILLMPIRTPGTQSRKLQSLPLLEEEEHLMSGSHT